MGSVSEIGVQMKKMLIISIRACHRSVCNHPFLVCLLGFLIFLYRSFPFVFSILVSASPVLVCTAVLLGTLLSFGQPNIPEVEKEEEVTHGISSFQTEFSEGTTFIAEKDESLVVKTHTENTGVVEERSTEEASLVGDKGRDVEEGEDLTSYMPLIDEAEASQDFQNEKQVIEQADREFCSFDLEKKSEVQEQKLKAEGVSSDDEALEEQYVFVQKVNDDILDIEGTAEEPLQTFNGDHLDFSPSSSWKQVENNEEEDSFDSESDRAESSSPDASMADIMPMLDELHPLLDLEGSRPAHLSRDGSTASEKSQKSNDGSIESDEDTENQVEVEEDGVDEHDDEEEEGGKEDESKAAIKWTEDDQKNLMDLGTSELERNQRLENLIARRRVRRMMTEKNLIDLESSDLPFNVAPITTTRRNPFDFLDDSHVAMGLPPIPGSAPSVLQPRRNPFDIPYDPNEEKPDLKGDSFEQEFMVFNQKDTLFRRHESFSLRPSGLGTIKHGRQDMSWKPVFVSEQMASEGTSYAPFQRQLSEVSETMLSSVQDTESLSSTDQDERRFNEQDFSQETELISDVSHASLCVERGSQSPGEVDSMEMVQVEESNAHHDEAEIVLGGVENLSDAELYSETREVTVHEEFNIGDSEAHLGSEPVDEESNSQSSGSSLSEVIDSIPDEKGGISTSMQSGDNHLQDSRVSSQDFVEEVDFHNLSGEVEDNQHGEPLYDSSPLPAQRFASFSSVSSDSAAEISERSLPPAPEETIANLKYKSDHILEVNGSGYEENHSEISQLHIEVNNELNSGDSRDINQHDFNVAELAAVPKRLLGHDGTSAPESEVMQPVYVDSSLSSDVGAIKAETSTVFVHEQEQADHLHAESEFIKDNSGVLSSDYHIASVKSEPLDQEFVEEGAEHYGVDSSKPDDEIVSEVVQEVDEKLDLVASYSEHAPSSDSLMSKPMVNPDLPSEETESVEEGSVHYGMDSSRLDDENMSEVVQDADEKPDLVTSYSRCMPSSDSLISAPQDSEPLLVAEQAPVVHLNLPSEETEHGEKVLSHEIDMLEVQQNSVFSSNFFEPGETELHQDKEVPSSSDCQYLQFEVKSPSVLEDDLSSLDKSVVSPPFCEHDETQVSHMIVVPPVI